MYTLLNRVFGCITTVIGCFVVGLTLGGCALIDLRNLAIVTLPAEADAILREGEEVSVSFSRPVLEDAVELLIHLETDEGTVECDYLWKEKTVTLKPLIPFLQATRYYLEVDGRIPLANGTFREADVLIPFYVISKEERMILSQVSPELNGTAGPEAPVIFTFSLEPDLKSFLLHFSLSPDTPFLPEKEGTSITITPKDTWRPGTVYEWFLSTPACSATGIPLQTRRSGFYLVQEDVAPPELLSSYTTVYTGDEPAPLSEDLCDIGFRDDIALQFSEPVRYSTVSDALSINPVMEGHLKAWSDSLYIFTPIEGWDFQTMYTLSVSTALTDLSGNCAVRTFTTSFMPETIPAITITALEGVGGAVAVFSLDSFAPQVIDVDALDNGSYTFTIFFSHSYPPEFQTAIEDAVSLEFIAPGGQTPSRRSLLWGPGGSSLSIIFEHISSTPPLPGFSNLYQFTISGGEETGNGTGSYIGEDLVLVLECNS